MRILIAATPLTGHVTPLLAVGRVLSEPRFRRRADAMAVAFGALDASHEIVRVIDDLARRSPRETHGAMALAPARLDKSRPAATA